MWLNLLDLDVLANAPILGSIGDLGTTGETGAQGNTGPAGDAGPAGNTGGSGATGSDGLVGATGDAGSVGATGEVGVGATPDFFEDFTIRTTSSTSFVEYTSWNTPSLEAGTYRFGWHLVYRITGDEKAHFRFQLDDSDTLAKYITNKPNDSGSKRNISGFTFRSLSAGTYTIDLDHKIEEVDTDVKIFEARFELVRVG